MTRKEIELSDRALQSTFKHTACARLSTLKSRDGSVTDIFTTHAPYSSLPPQCPSKVGTSRPFNSSLSHTCCSLIRLYQAASILGKVPGSVAPPGGSTVCNPQPAHQIEPNQVEPHG